MEEVAAGIMGFIILFGGGMIIGFCIKGLFDTCVEDRVKEELRRRGINE